jgi:predicted phage tail component-like protein
MALEKNAFSFNGVDYGTTHKIIVRDHDYPLLPRPRLYKRNYAAASGAMIQGSTYEPLYITLDCALKYSTPSAPFTELRAVATALNATLGSECDLILGWESGKVYSARLDSEFNPERQLTHALFTLVFVCPDPIPEDVGT